MALADDIASKVGSPSDEGEPIEEAVLKAGDAGKRALAAIKSNDAIALEEAIRDCMSTY